jgi:hypothetical protein
MAVVAVPWSWVVVVVDRNGRDRGGDSGCQVFVGRWERGEDSPKMVAVALFNALHSAASYVSMVKSRGWRDRGMWGDVATFETSTVGMMKGKAEISAFSLSWRKIALKYTINCK